MTVVYLDNAATVKPSETAVKAFNEAADRFWQNPSSAYSPSIASRKKLEEARAVIAQALGCLPEEVYFVSGGTEGNNIAISGLLKANTRLGRHIITTQGEHPAVLNVFKNLAENGYDVTFVPLKRDGTADMDALVGAIRQDTALISCMLVNNETGAINDVGQIGVYIKENKLRTLLHTDAVQGFLKLPFSVSDLGCDALTISAHKFGGVKGAGALYVKKGAKISAAVYGGGQEGGLRSGTQATECILAMAAACSDAVKNFDERLSHLLYMSKLAREKVKLLGGEMLSDEHACAHILSCSFPGYRSEVLLRILNDRGVCVSAGSACSTGKNARSHVLTAMKLNPKIIDGAIRVSFSYDTTKEDIEKFSLALKTTLESIIKV